MTMIIVTGGIDLSAGSILGLCAIMLGVLWKNLGLPLELAIALTLVIGTAAGLVNGWIITRIGVPPLIATLATLALYRGLAEGISQARSVRGYPDWFFVLGQRDLGGIPTQLWLLGVAILVFGVVARPHQLRPHPLRHRQQRDRVALLRPAGRPRQAHHLRPLRLHGRHSPPGSSSAGSAPPARTWAPASSST